MKILLLFINFINVAFLIAQSFPARFNYQVSIRDSAGKPISDRSVSFRISILENPNDKSFYSYREVHNGVMTNFGTASLVIGNGVAKDGTPIDLLPFQSKTYHLRVELDEDRDGDFDELITTQLISVPYALVASQLSQNNAKDGQVLKWIGGKWVPVNDGGGSGGGGTVTRIETGLGLQGGPITNTGTISLSNTGVQEGNYGSSTQIPILKINATGQIVSASTTSVSSGLGGTVTEIRTGQGLIGGPITNNGTISLANSGVIAGTYGSSTAIPRITVNQFGQVTSVAQVPINAGGSQNWSSINTNDIINSNPGKVFIGNTGSHGELWIQRSGSGSSDNNTIFAGYIYPANSQVGPYANLGIADKSKARDMMMRAGFRLNPALNQQPEMFVLQGQKNFVMEHPIHADSVIVYSCIEGPEAAAYERGTARLENGRAKVNFSGHFGLVINPSTMTINLTPLSLESKGLAIISRDANGFVVGELNQGFGNYEFDWEVKAVRKGFENNKVIRHISEYQINTEPSKE